MIARNGFWIWDSWYVQDSGDYHAFYLKAPTSLADPDLRHAQARVGHSVSRDLVSWTTLPDALPPGAIGEFDDLAIWTGSIVRHDDVWHLFYTGVEQRSRTRIQRVGHATSVDLIVWDRVSPTPVTTADARWYSTAAAPPEFDEPWRDPWVFHSAADGLWHMLVTAREPDADASLPGAPTHGSVGHCVSADLFDWQVAPSLSRHSGFAQLEVLQVLEVAGHHVVVFCATAQDVIAAGVEAVTATFTAPADGPLGPFHFDRAEPIRAAGIYAGRILQPADGGPVLLGFVESDADGLFVGVICDPIPLQLTSRGTLQPHSAAEPDRREA
ncbi:glycosyl hydrolase family 32 [Cryobacterium cryoconiti]|uniref:glycosyl hydrolase family 32 n=1 Tax=Cryobacterium cryoconiti TaxID=1259239 RepID=UPI00141B39F0|nr:glycosyl hydrolase family 32 [Cryobacterium cryoconiti]